MDNKILSFLQTSKKKTVSLGELERLVEGQTSYEAFAIAVNNLVEKGILVPVKKHGDNHKTIPLANTYRIIQSKIFADHLQEIERLHFLLDPQIKLEAYYSLTASEWNRDLPYLLQINNYLQQHGWPNSEATAPERSYALVGDEKWIDEKGGKKLLERVGIWSVMQIVSRPDPLMLAINQPVWNEAGSLHLVVENKTTFHALLEHMRDTSFLTLIYGAGWKVTADIFMLDQQLGREQADARIFYFGDLDYEGISIWHAVNSRRPVVPAVWFYRALLAKPAAQGKTNQICNEEALSHFLTWFTPEEQKQIREILSHGGYSPQEVLNSAELGDIWRNSTWS
ncbi:MAG: DUF2399 domain-containing protein [Syntrophomonadaceae bacterium]|nr:DUF2399 domain-containing protein [Syntrophomonadaceae bacterium]